MYLQQRSPCRPLPVPSLPRDAGEQRSRAFTLVEMALALGIVSFALVALLGMLPIGLQASRAAGDLTVTTEITHRLVGMIEQAGYSKCSSDPTIPNSSTLESSFYYFDAGGAPLVPASAGVPPADALFSANIVVLPTGTSSILASDVSASSVVCLQINIVNDPGHVQSGTPTATVPTSLAARCTIVPVFLANNGN